MKIFLIIFDTLRKDHTGNTYGNNWIKTPNFDLFAKDCIIFDKAYPESLPTIPVRRAIHTGIRTFPFNHKRPILRTDDVVEAPGWHPIPPQQTHLSEYLKSFGYKTAFITSTYHQFKPNMNFHLGYDQWNWIRGHENDKFRAILRKGKTKLDQMVNEHIVSGDPDSKKYQKFILNRYFPNIQNRKNEEHYFPAKTFKKAIEFTKDTRGIKKTFCLIDEFDPHEPWDPPQKYLDLYIDENYKGKKVITPAYRHDIDYLTQEELEYMRACYAGEVSLCDAWFGYFLNELRNMELYEESLIIFISDHGHSIGEHNATGKIPYYMYPELVDIPFMIKPPNNINGPKRIKERYVYDFDILPTIFGFLNEEKPDILEGIDLSILIEENGQYVEDRVYVTCGFHACTLYKDNNYALITSNDRSYQRLFDLSKDPDWSKNIAEDNQDICNDLFNIIERDAKGVLLMEDEKQLNEMKDWYKMKEE
ncbi:MAG: sulfatase [Candidatus Hermodarchaeota archaeon]